MTKPELFVWKLGLTELLNNAYGARFYAANSYDVVIVNEVFTAEVGCTTEATRLCRDGGAARMRSVPSSK